MRGPVEAHRQRRASHRLGAVLLGVAPLGRHRLQPAPQQGVVVGVAERGARVQQAQADVGRPVAHPEDPAVPGQQPVAVPQVEPGFQVVIVMPRAPVIRPDRDAERAVVALAQAHRHRQPRRVAVRGHHDSRVVGALGLVVLARQHPGDPAGALVEDGAGHGDALEQLRAGLLRAAGQRLVQVMARPDQAEAGVARQFGPGQFHPLARADDAQALVPDPAVLLADADAHADEGLDRARGEPVAADLLPGEPGLLEHQDVKPRLRQVKGGRRAGGPGADHDDVRLVSGRPRPGREASATGLGFGGSVFGHLVRS